MDRGELIDCLYASVMFPVWPQDDRAMVDQLGIESTSQIHDQQQVVGNTIAVCLSRRHCIRWRCETLPCPIDLSTRRGSDNAGQSIITSAHGEPLHSHAGDASSMSLSSGQRLRSLHDWTVS